MQVVILMRSVGSSQLRGIQQSRLRDGVYRFPTGPMKDMWFLASTEIKEGSRYCLAEEPIFTAPITVSQNPAYQPAG